MSPIARTTRRPDRRPRAFTLVEVLMVVIIIGIAAAIVVPRAARTDPFRVQAAARAVVGDLAFAQNEAIGNQERRTVVFDPANDSYQLLRPGDSGDEPLTAPWMGGDYIVRLGPNGRFGQVDLVSTTFADDSISFDDLGAPDGGGRVVLAAGQRLYTVEVTPLTGRITVTEGQEE